ncbi:MAG TPA: TonB family protein [Chroococcales cyanobacterium]
MKKRSPLTLALLLSLGLHGALIFSGNRLPAPPSPKRLIDIEVIQREKKSEPPKKSEKRKETKKTRLAKRNFRTSRRFSPLVRRIPPPPKVFGVSKSNYIGDIPVAEGNMLAADPEVKARPGPSPPIEKIENQKFWPTGECDSPPVPETSIQPVYPDFAKTGGIAGKVVLEIDIDAAGRVVEVRVLKSAHSSLSEAAIDAVRHARFKPAIKDGERVAVTMRFTFSLSEQP